jgi:hypothetical protein
MLNSEVVPENPWIKVFDEEVCLRMCTLMTSRAIKVHGQSITPRTDVKIMKKKGQ